MATDPAGDGSSDTVSMDAMDEKEKNQVETRFGPFWEKTLLVERVVKQCFQDPGKRPPESQSQ